MMELTFATAFVAVIVLILNVLDSVTTELCFKQYPDKELKGEANPYMRWLMLKNKTLAEVVKQVVGVVVVVILLMEGNLEVLRLAAILLGLVVLNNTFVVVSRVVARRKMVGPLKQLITLLHIPDNFAFLVATVVLIGLALMINNFIWG